MVLADNPILCAIHSLARVPDQILVVRCPDAGFDELNRVTDDVLRVVVRIGRDWQRVGEDFMPHEFPHMCGFRYVDDPRNVPSQARLALAI